MTYHERVLALRAESKKELHLIFRFEDLFSKEEWLSMSLQKDKSRESISTQKSKIR